jgi:hypothetical protein
MQKGDEKSEKVVEYVNLLKNKNEDIMKIVYVETIPMCDDCLFEIKDGQYACEVCMKNYCESHKNSHLFKLNAHKFILLKINKK